jgi:hypothetical protein
MTTIGGPILEVTFAGRTFFSASDAAVTISIGGKNNAIEPNGNGTARTIQTVMPWKVEGAALNINTANGDLEFLQDATDRGDDEVFSVTMADGTVYQGVGTTTSELPHDTSKATAAINFGGPRKLTAQ